MRTRVSRDRRGGNSPLRPRRAFLRLARRGRVYRNREGRPGRRRPARTTAAPPSESPSRPLQKPYGTRTDITDRYEEREGAARLMRLHPGVYGEEGGRHLQLFPKRSGGHSARIRARCCASRSWIAKILRYALTLIPYSRAVACSACFSAGRQPELTSCSHHGCAWRCCRPCDRYNMGAECRS